MLSIAKDREIRILFPKGGAEGVVIQDGIRYFEAGQVRDFFGENVFEKVFSVPINREGAIFRLECILISDDQESMLIYAQDGNRMAVIITLPFITCVQSRLFSEMIDHAHELSHEDKDLSDGRNMTGKKELKKGNQRSRKER